jgi:hypothetical protein
MKATGSTILGCFVVLIVAIIVLAWLAARDPVNQSKWNSISEGMTKSEVIAILGNPDRYDGTDQIEYTRPFNQGWVEFIFDKDQRLIEKNDESVFVSLERK